MSLKQMELMYTDCPVTVYPKTDTCKGGRGGKKDYTFGRLSKASIEVGRQRWEKMKRDKAEGKDRGFVGWKSL